MSHDPYCPLREHEVDHMDDYWCDESCTVDCQCDLIARVREDALTNTALINEIRNEQFSKGYAAALRDAVEAVKSLGSEDIRLAELLEVIAEIEALGGES